MKLALEIVAGVVVLLFVLGALLRLRKLRRDERRERPLDRRLVVPPPSPYATSKGFRVLDGTDGTLERAPLERPRIDPARQYVFSDPDELPVIRARHNEDWFLSRSSHRSTASLVARTIGVLAVIAIVITVVVTYYVDHHPATTKPPTTTTTLAAATTTTTTSALTLTLTSTSGDDAYYRVAASRYRVTVYGERGETWAEYQMGVADTLEWQGPVDLGARETLVMTGDSRITIGSPSSARVSVDGGAVTFPAPLPPTLVLVFQASS